MLFDKLYEFSKTDRMAAFDGEKFISYRDLWMLSEAVALYLQKDNSKLPVAIYGDKENGMLVCIYGALKAGRPYVVLPSYYPQQRVDAILKDCGADIVLNPAEKRIENRNIEVLTAKEIDALAVKYKGKEAPKENHVKPGDNICILYTSGSTGIPKGVVLTYENIMYKIEQSTLTMKGVYPEEGGKGVNFSAYSFSASLGSVFNTIPTVGATLYNVPRAVLKDHDKLMKFLFEVQPNSLFGTPSMITRMLATPQFDSVGFSSLRYLCTGGEPLSSELAIRLKARFPDLILYNGYGTTETAASPMLCSITDELIAKMSGYFPIGAPLLESGAFLLDDNGNEITEDNVVGELIISGKCVSRGYLNRPELTETAFFTTAKGERAYRTKDLAKRIDGLYYFVGRKDNQVKIGGNRIELEDVEANLRTVDIVRECAVTVKKGAVDFLVAFVVRKDSSMSNMKAILATKNELKARVESHMIPQKIVFVDELPKNINLKVDRVALKNIANEM